MVCLCMVLAVVFCFTACSEFKVADLEGTWKCVETDPEIPEEDMATMVLDNKGRGHDANNENVKYAVSLGKNKTFTASISNSINTGNPAYGKVDFEITMNGKYSFDKKSKTLKISDITWAYRVVSEEQGELDPDDFIVQEAKEIYDMTYMKFEKQ